MVDKPVWQPDGGKVGGALLFDGVDDRLDTPFVLNPADGPFSVVAWVQGDMPGRVILSQSGGNDWLLTDAGGVLMTDLRGSGRMATPLYSQAVITDGQWHRIGLTWDGFNRTLYVDGVTPAEDVPGLLPDISEGLHIGAGANLDPGAFFAGRIDDVRIYNRAVRPIIALASAELWIDQENDVPTGTTTDCGVPSGGRGSIFQTFTPTAPTLDAVWLKMRAGGKFPRDGYTTSIAIWKGTAPTQGSELARASAFALEPQSGGSAIDAYFQLIPPLLLIPGDTYVIEWFSPVEGRVVLTWFRSGNTYSGGTSGAYCVDEVLAVIEDFDMIFATFTSAHTAVPEEER